MMHIFLIILICLSVVSSQVMGPLDGLPNGLSFESGSKSHSSNHNELTQSLSIKNSQVQIIEPSLQIVLIVNPYNKLNELSIVLSGIEQQNYPKNRINVLILTEIYNSVASGQYDREIEKLRLNDQTIKLLSSWKRSVELEYHEVELRLTEIDDDHDDENDEQSTDYWSTNRYEKLMNYKFIGFNHALNKWADYCLFQDADAILINPNTFHSLLINQTRSVFSPMLLSLSLYSNFWAGVDDKGYYKRTENYIPILERQKIGVFEVPMIHSIVFIDLRDKIARDLKFRFKDLEHLDQFRNQLNKIPFDDMIVFAKSAQSLNLSFYIDNNEIYGFIPPSIEKLDLNEQKQNLLDLELDCLVETNKKFKISNSLLSYHPSYETSDQTTISSLINRIYVINLERRHERQEYMKSTCDVLRLKCEFIKAVDGKLIDKQYFIKNKIQVMKNYLDPFHKRPMTHGEIGCFMSHYSIWLDAIRNNYSWSIVFEDDVKFERDFTNKFNRMIHSIQNQRQGETVDFIYLGRKQEGKSDEESRFNDYTVRPTYSYWTIGYVISLNGAKKLVNSKPLEKMLPVDDYLPIMYNKHPNNEWSSQFTQSDLIALSASPLLIQPLHYVGDDAYISDTENSQKLTEHIEL